MDYRAFSEGHKGSGLASVTVETKLPALSESRSQCSHPFSNLPHELAECIHFAIGYLNHKLESRLAGEIATTSDMQMIPL